MENQAFHIGIIGFGPKGFYGFERLLANLNQLEISSEIHIHLYNSSPAFATGWIYDIDQPRYLLMNYSDVNISAKPVSAPSAICDMLSFSEWLLTENNAQSPKQSNISPRAKVGEYLKYYFEILCQSAASNIKILKHSTTVNQIIPKRDKFLLETANQNSKQLEFSSLLITTGHSPSINAKLNEYQDRETHIPFIYPTETQLKNIEADSKVACKGMGLTAIDAILALTEGRGGKFEIEENGNLIYHRSGKEPQKIFPFSRSGYPLLPRFHRRKKPKKHSFYFKDFVNSLSENSGPFDFEMDILPEIEKDIISEYYYHLFEKYGKKLPLDKGFNYVSNAIENFHAQHPAEKKFRVNDLFYPAIASSNSYHDDFISYWKNTVDNATAKNHPLSVAASTWQNLTDDFNRLYKNDKLTPVSKSKFTRKYFPLFNRIAHGPPLINVQKMIALADTGLLDFSFSKNPDLLKTERGKYLLKQQYDSASCDMLIDARLPRGFKPHAETLFNPSEDHGLFTFKHSSNALDFANSLECTKKGNPINSKGKPIKNITLYGTPMEGQLFDNDSLSRKRNDTASQWAKNISQQIKTLQL